MILFVNVLITNNQFSRYPRYNLPSFDRLDVFKYSLASLSVINFNKVFIYVELEPPFLDRREELHDYCKHLFQDKLEINDFTIMHQQDWVGLTKSFPDDLVFLLCNDDHIFIDSNLNLLQVVQDKLKQHERASFYLSHWPEVVRLAANCAHKKQGRLVSFQSHNTDSIQILTKALFDYWIHEGDVYEGPTKLHQRMRRTDKRYVSLKHWTMYAPLRETMRHFDGYGHVIRGGANLIPPLAIPDGFFYNNIKILYCPKHRQKGFVHLNPMAEHLFACNDITGMDYRWFLHDIPLFWRSAISSIEIVRKIPTHELMIAKNKFTKDILNIKIANSTWYGDNTVLPPEHWFKEMSLI